MMMLLSSSLSLFQFSLILIVGLFSVFFVLFPLVLMIVGSIFVNAKNNKERNSKLYVGQVWHTRFHPKVHKFTYPIFMFALDLEEIMMMKENDDLFFPFSFFRIINFYESNHLKNGEGLLKKNDTDKESRTTSTSTTNKNNKNNSLAERILRLVSTKTNGNFIPSLRSHRILLLTHLSYYGYSFNPVSFYYIIDKKTNRLSALVGEVSNTPWTEMYCYVLHPDSDDQVRATTNTTNNNCRFYSFPKEFHVSPFMEMEYWYDWSFLGVPGKEKLTIINSLRRRRSDDNTTMAFTATLKLKEGQDITPFTMGYQMLRFPVFCFIIQIWIHYQAMWLFLKGVVYVPHPKGSETTASIIIAKVMTPFFAIREAVTPKSKTT